LIKNIDDQNFENAKILKINFEDFVLKHQNTVEQISKFILEDINLPKDNFNLERSKNNLLKFKNLLSDLELATIEKLLGKHLYFKQ